MTAATLIGLPLVALIAVFLPIRTKPGRYLAITED